MKGLWRRLVTAVVFVIIMLVGLFTGPYSFSLLFLVIAAACLWEFFNLTLDIRTRRDKIRKALGVLMGVTPIILVTLLKVIGVNEPEVFVSVASLLFGPLVFTMFIYELYSRSKEPFTNIAFTMLGLFYIGIPFALIYFIAFDGEVFYYRTVFGILLLTWVNDTGAYLVGSQLGKTPLFPSISPNKTWEGTVGGILTCLIFGAILGCYFEEVTFSHWLGLAVIVSIFGSFGDLIESMLKRSVGVKDSGTLLPGHGGVLDRFDAFIFAMPFAAAYILFFR